MLVNELRKLEKDGLLLLYIGSTEPQGTKGRMLGVIFCLVGQVHMIWEVLYLQNKRVGAYNPAICCINIMLLQPSLLRGNEVPKQCEWQHCDKLEIRQ